MTKIKAKSTGENGAPDKVVEFDWQLPTTVEEMVTLVGAETAVDYFCAKATINLQNAARMMLADGMEPDAVVKAMSEYKLGQQNERKRDPMTTVMRNLSSLTPEQIQQLLDNARKQLETAQTAGTEQAPAQATEGQPATT